MAGLRGAKLSLIVPGTSLRKANTKIAFSFCFYVLGRGGYLEIEIGETRQGKEGTWRRKWETRTKGNLCRLNDPGGTGIFSRFSAWDPPWYSLSRQVTNKQVKRKQESEREKNKEKSKAYQKEQLLYGTWRQQFCFLVFWRWLNLLTFFGISAKYM